MPETTSGDAAVASPALPGSQLADRARAERDRERRQRAETYADQLAGYQATLFTCLRQEAEASFGQGLGEGWTLVGGATGAHQLTVETVLDGLTPSLPARLRYVRSLGQQSWLPGQFLLVVPCWQCGKDDRTAELERPYPLLRLAALLDSLSDLKQAASRRFVCETCTAQDKAAAGQAAAAAARQAAADGLPAPKLELIELVRGIVREELRARGV